MARRQKKQTVSPVPKKPRGLPKAYRIKRTKLFDLLLSEGKSVFLYPFKLVYAETALPEDVPFQVAFGVSKKKFKKAVKLNRIKRLMRESFRLEQDALPQDKPLALWLIYVGKEEEKFTFMRKRMRKLLEKLSQTQADNGTAQ